MKCRVRSLMLIKLAFLRFITCRIHWVYVILLHFSHDLYNRSSPSFSSNTFQNFLWISHLISEVCKFEHHRKLLSKCATLLVHGVHRDKFNLNVHTYYYWMFSDECDESRFLLILKTSLFFLWSWTNYDCRYTASVRFIMNTLKTFKSSWDQ